MFYDCNLDNHARRRQAGEMIKKAIKKAFKLGVNTPGGASASYIPELAAVNPDLIGLAVKTVDGTYHSECNQSDDGITLQSAAKCVLLIGMLEEFGPEQVFKWVDVEPSGTAFSSVARLDQFGPLPSNPMLNSGAIALCSHIPGNHEQRLAWLEHWMCQCFGEKLNANNLVFASERRTGDRNRSLAYLLKSTGQMDGDVDEILETYFYLCAVEATLAQAVVLPTRLARLGLTLDGERIFSKDTALKTISVMATCGLYNESGAHMVATGLPAKSSVSGFIFAVAPGKAGIVTLGPRVNNKGTSIAGEAMLQSLSESMDWHFAA